MKIDGDQQEWSEEIKDLLNEGYDLQTAKDVVAQRYAPPKESAIEGQPKVKKR